MPAGFGDTAKNTMLDAITPAVMKLHTGDPGTGGTANEYAGGSYSAQSCAYDAAASGARQLTADVTFAGVSGESATWASVWTAGGATWLGNFQLTGDTTFNASNQLKVIAAGPTQMTI